MTSRPSLGPVPTFQLRPWPAQMTQAWTSRTIQIDRISRRAGVGRDFDLTLEQIRKMLTQNRTDELLELLRTPRCARALVTLWLDDSQLARTTMSTRLLTGLAAAMHRSRLTTITATTLFLRHFDLLDHWQEGLFTALSDLLRSAVSHLPPGRHTGPLDVLRESADFLVRTDGPTRLARHLIATDQDLTDWLRTVRLWAHADSRFGRRVRDAHYLELIHTADAERPNHPFLTAVTADILAHQRTDSDRLLFGHQVLTALTSKTTRRPNQVWIDAVIRLGGDPRMRQDERWQRWWSKIPEPQVRRAVRWMQALDLRAFLDGVEDYAQDRGDDGMIRMLGNRRRMLLGLYEQDRVENVRLILGSNIRKYIQKSSKIDLFDAASIRESSYRDLAIVYLDCEDFCLVEGSHNFSLHVFVGGPLEYLADPRRPMFEVREIREVIPAQHMERYGDGSHLSIPHQGTGWVGKALEHLSENGIMLEERPLMRPELYAQLLQERENTRYRLWR